METKERKEATKAKKKKKGKGKKALKIIAIVLCVLVVFFSVGAVVSVVGNKANIEKAAAFPKVEKEDTIVPEKDENGYWTFTTDEDFKVLQLTDIHIGGGWLSLKKDAMALNAVAAMIAAEKPDLVIATGDISYPVPYSAGTLNNLSSAKVFAALMEQLGVYWTLSFGNHDTEIYSYYSREDISEFYQSEEFKYCLYEPGPENIDGYGNQVINVKNSDGIITQSLFKFNTHSYTEGDNTGSRWKYANIHQTQINWYNETLLSLNAQNYAIYKDIDEDKKSYINSAAFMQRLRAGRKDAWDEY